MEKVRITIDKDKLLSPCQKILKPTFYLKLRKQIEEELGEDTFYYCDMKIGEVTIIEIPNAPINDLTLEGEMEFIPISETVGLFEQLIDRLIIGL